MLLFNIWFFRETEPHAFVAAACNVANRLSRIGVSAFRTFRRLCAGTKGCLLPCNKLSFVVQKVSFRFARGKLSHGAFLPVRV